LIGEPERRLPFLDFLRAIAVLLVINQHMAAAFGKHMGTNKYTDAWLTRNGWIGVDLFFVLSGFFIGSQLWKELKSTGTVSVRNFVIRRGLRIWPLYFFVFVVVFITAHGAPTKQHGWTDLVFISNYVNHGIVQGSWSLCSEEQFYIITPVVLLFFANWTMRRYRIGLMFLLTTLVVIRVLTYIHLAGHLFVRNPVAFAKLYSPFHTHCDGLIVGLFIANLAIEQGKVGAIWKRPALVSIVALGIFVLMGRIQPETLGFLGLALLFGALVWWGRALQAIFFRLRLFYWLSRLSFGMYLNHEYMQSWVLVQMSRRSGVFGSHPTLSTASCVLLLTIVSMSLSAVTYLLVEHPFLVLRTSILRRKVAAPLVAR